MVDIRGIAYAGYFLSDTISVEGSVWDGSGLEDVMKDWVRTGFGTENSSAKRTGTNGLDATGMSAGEQLIFTKNFFSLDLVNLDLLTFWVKITSWQAGKDIEISLSNDDVQQGVSRNLSSYVNIDDKNLWIKAIIDLQDFNIPGNTGQGDPVPVDRLLLEATGDIDIYFDDMTFSLGAVSRIPVPVYDITILSEEVGTKTVTGQFDTEDSIRIVNTFRPPEIG